MSDRLDRGRVWRGRLARPAIALALGATTAVGLAWYLALRPVRTYTFTHMIGVNIAPQEQRTYQANFTFTDEYRPGFRRILVRTTGSPMNDLIVARIAAELASVDHTPDYSYTGGTPVQRPQRPGWFSWLPRRASDGLPFDEVSARASGWPWLCLCSVRERSAGNSTARIRGSLPIVSVASYPAGFGSDPDLGAAPLIPIWAGLAGNAAVFALPWLGVLVVVPAVRRAMRLRRGLCTHCGYDLRATPSGLPCPECGHASSSPYTNRKRNTRPG